MTRCHRNLLCALLTATAGASATHAALLGNFVSQISVYDDPSTVRVGYEVPAGQNIFLNVAGEYGDSARLAGGGGIFAGLSLEYYANYAREGGLTLRLYGLDESGMPSGLLDSRQLNVREGGAILDVSFAYDLRNAVGGALAYTVEFAGLGNGQKAGLIVPDRTPTAGTSPEGYLQRSEQGWAVATVGGTLVDGQPRLKSAVDPEGNVALTLQADPSSRYRLRKLTPASAWLEVAVFVTDANGTARFVFTDASAGAHLYQVQSAD